MKKQMWVLASMFLFGATVRAEPVPKPPLDLATAPKTPLAGQSNGQAWTPTSLTFVGSASGWLLQMHDDGDETRQLDLPIDGVPKKGAKLSRTRGVCVNDGGMVQVSIANEAQNINGAECNFVLELTSWPTKAPAKLPGQTQTLGTASGRLVALASELGRPRMKGPTYVVGTFKDVKVTFWQK